MTLKEKCVQILRLWTSQKDGAELFKFTGRYWEVLYPLLKKYSPAELQKYEQKVGEDFDYFNPAVKAAVTTYNEEEDFKNAIQFANQRMNSGAKADDVDYVEVNEEDIPYVPNQNIDIKQHYGREDEEAEQNPS